MAADLCVIENITEQAGSVGNVSDSYSAVPSGNLGRHVGHLEVSWCFSHSVLANASIVLPRVRTFPSISFQVHYSLILPFDGT
jgi:hypothetical protein